jgi:starch synthase
LNLKVIFLAAEVEPYTKVGGLGGVAGALPQALRKLFPPEAGPDGVDIRLVIPMHASIHREDYKTQPVASFHITHAQGSIQAEVEEYDQDGLPVYMIDAPLIS